MTGQTFDLGPQALIVARLAEGVTDAHLDGATPCPEYAVHHLLGHLTGLAVAFRDAARKDLGATTDTAPDSALPDIGPDWREALPKALDELADAWRDPAAWTGTTRAGGVTLPGPVAGAVVADELVVHGWDLARATGQEYAPTRRPCRPRTVSSPPWPRTRRAAEASSVPSCRCPTTRPSSTARSGSAAATPAGPRRACPRPVPDPPTGFPVRSVDGARCLSYFQRVVLRTSYMRRDM